MVWSRMQSALDTLPTSGDQGMHLLDQESVQPYHSLAACLQLHLLRPLQHMGPLSMHIAWWEHLPLSVQMSAVLTARRRQECSWRDSQGLLQDCARLRIAGQYMVPKHVMKNTGSQTHITVRTGILPVCVRADIAHYSCMRWLQTGGRCPVIEVFPPGGVTFYIGCMAPLNFAVHGVDDEDGYRDVIIGGQQLSVMCTSTDTPRWVAWISDDSEDFQALPI